MVLTPYTPISAKPFDYFTIESVPYGHFSDETPCTSPAFSADEPSSAHPQNPLLAQRRNSKPLSEMASNFMALQTAAAHNTTRPAPKPLQNVLHVTSDDSDSSASSSSNSNSTVSSVELARCSRCQRTPSIDLRTGKSNMVSYGLNLWYCSRCAAMVGYNR